jgi:hypothetical protein
VSPDLISTVTDAVLETVAEWQGRPLDACYPLVFFDATRVKIRDEGFVRNKAVYIALGILPDGTKEILGIWIKQTEGAKFWMRVMNELKNRGVADILIVVVDGLKGFPDAINAVFPETLVQTCIVHLIRNSMSFASWKDRKVPRSRCRPVASPAPRISPHRIVSASITHPLQFLEDPHQRQPLAPGLAFVRLQQPLQVRRPRPQLRQRLNRPLIGERRLARAQNLAHRVARHAQVSHDLLDRLALDEKLAPNPCNRLNYRHPPTAPGKSQKREHHTSGGQF